MLRIFAVLLAIAGIVFAIDPSLLGDNSSPADTFSAIERRIKGGAILGVGLLLAFHTQLKPWLSTLAAIALWGSIGVLFARVLGLFLDGFDSQQQWIWVVVEAIVAVIAWLLLGRFNDKAAVVQATHIAQADSGSVEEVTQP